MGKLTREQANALADAYNGGLGSGMSPQQWKKAQGKKSTGGKKSGK